MTRIRVDERSEVQEPVFSEKRSCLKGGCFSSCGCLLMIGILLLLILRITWGPRTLTLSQLPAHFPAHELVYEPSLVQRITLTRAEDANRFIATTTALPRLVYVPAHQAYTIASSGGTWWDVTRGFTHQARMIFLSPGSTSSTDVYSLTWGQVNTDISRIRQFYMDAFSEMNFSTDIRFDNTNTIEILFSRQDISGTLLIENYDLKEDGVERMMLSVRVPHEP